MFFLVLGTVVVAAAAAPAVRLKLTPAALRSLPSSPESLRGYSLLSHGIGAGAVTPTHVVIDAGPGRAANRGPVYAADQRLANELFHDPEVRLVASGPRPPYSDRSGRYTRVIVVGRHEYGSGISRRFVARLRDRLVPRRDSLRNARLRRRRSASRRRLPRPHVPLLRVARARNAGAHLSGARARLPFAPPAAEGRDPEPALRRCRLRDARGGLPLRRRRRAARDPSWPRARRVGADRALRHALRALHRLRGVHGVADARGVGRGRDQRRGSRAGTAAQRPGRDGRGSRDGCRLPRVRRRPDSRPAAVRPRARARSAARRNGDPDPARAVDDGAARPLQLVAAAPARGRPPRPPRALRAHDSDGAGLRALL